MYTPDNIHTIAQLSAYLRTSEEQLIALMDGFKVIYAPRDIRLINPDAPRDKPFVFQECHIRKKNKKLGYRVIYKPKDQLTINILKILKFNLGGIFKPIDCVHGFVRNRNTRTNASVHLGKRFLLKLDIQNFFESININQVQTAFKSLGFKDHIAIALSKISTLEGKLAQGFSTSPIIANLVCSHLDLELSTICENKNWFYSRYADDISISSNVDQPGKKEIVEVIEKHDFKINNRKTQQFKRGQNQFVTGLSISDSQYPRIPKAIKRRLRQQLYYLRLHGYHSHICHINNWDEKTDSALTARITYELRNQIKGWIDYIHSIEPKVAASFYEDLNQIERNRIEKQKKIIEERGTSAGIIVLELNSPKPIPKRKSE